MVSSNLSFREFADSLALKKVKTHAEIYAGFENRIVDPPERRIYRLVNPNFGCGHPKEWFDCGHPKPLMALLRVP